MDTLVSLGYWGLFIGSFLASTIIPMSADVLLVGVLALGGNVWGCLAIATVGNWLGGLTSYWIGWLGRWDWIERWFKVKREKLSNRRTRGSLRRLACSFTWLPIVGDCLPLPSDLSCPSEDVRFLYARGAFRPLSGVGIAVYQYADRFIEWIS
ncbi:MAG: YqaA family protein [Butyricimonas faecihominis]